MSRSCHFLRRLSCLAQQPLHQIPSCASRTTTIPHPNPIATPSNPRLQNTPFHSNSAWHSLASTTSRVSSRGLATSTRPAPAHEKKSGSCGAGSSGSETAAESACFSCDRRFKRGGFVCGGCDAIQPLDSSLSYFEIMGMEDMKFDLDLQKLEKSYKMLQWQLHPDKAGSRSPEEREHSAEHSSMINMAYSILKTPLSRANYILARRGVGGPGEEQTVSDPELLMEVMEAREEVASTEDPAHLAEILRVNRERQAGLVQKLGVALDSTTGASEAAQLATHLSYLSKLEEEIVKKMPH